VNQLEKLKARACCAAGCLFLTLVARGRRISVSRLVVPPMPLMVPGSTGRPRERPA